MANKTLTIETTETTLTFSDGVIQIEVHPRSDYYEIIIDRSTALNIIDHLREQFQIKD